MTILQKTLKSLGMSQNQLAYMTRIPPGNLSYIARGQMYPCPAWRRRISEAVGVPEAILFAHRHVEGGPDE